MHIVAATQPQGPMHLHSVADNLLEALAVTACTTPALFPALMGNSEDTEGRLLDRWVAIASTRYALQLLSPLFATVIHCASVTTGVTTVFRPLSTALVMVSYNPPRL